jgi:hypothetical protein
VVRRADTDPVKHMRLAALQRSRPLLGGDLITGWRARADRFPGALATALLQQALTEEVLTGWQARDALEDTVLLAEERTAPTSARSGRPWANAARRSIHPLRASDGSPQATRPGATRPASAQNNLIWPASATFGLNQDHGHNEAAVAGGLGLVR